MNDMTFTGIVPPAPPKSARFPEIVPLTNHALIAIFPDEWAMLAEGFWSNGDADNPDHQEIGIKVLYLREAQKIPVHTVGDGETIVYAWAKSDDPDDDSLNVRVYAGRLLTERETIARGSCDRHILAVADELRQRIDDVSLRHRVTAVEHGPLVKCHASLSWRPSLR